MRLDVHKSFEKDIEKITDKKTAAQVNAILESLENCISLSEVRNLKKMKTKGNYYRIRAGNYRLGLRCDSDKLVLLRFMHRRDIYTYFP